MDDLLMLGDASVLALYGRSDTRRTFAEDFSSRRWEPIESADRGLGAELLSGLIWLGRCLVAPLRQARTPEAAPTNLSKTPAAEQAEQPAETSPSRRLAA